jgi:hypothetical protein
MRTDGLRFPFGVLLCLLAMGWTAAELPAGEADVGARPGQVVLTLHSGEVVRGVVLVSGPRGYVVATEEDDRLETFVARTEVAAVRRLEDGADAEAEDRPLQWKTPDDPAEPQPREADLARTETRRYKAEVVRGILEIVSVDNVPAVEAEEEPDDPDVSLFGPLEEEEASGEDDDGGWPAPLFGEDEPRIETGRAGEKPAAGVEPFELGDDAGEEDAEAGIKRDLF